MDFKKNIPIFLASDDNYAPFLCTTMYSILEHTKSFIDFYVMDGGISNANKELIKESLANFEHKTIKYFDMAQFNLKRFPNLKHYSLNAFSRFFIPELASKLEKVLYLDVDIIVKGDIAELYYQDLEGYPVGAILEDFYAGNYTTLKEKIWPAYEGGDRYFNSGVMLLDVQKFIQNEYQKKLIQLTIDLYDNLNTADQDVFNILFENNFKVLDYRYNFMPDHYHLLREKHPQRGMFEPLIIHYTSKKPWKEKGNHWQDFDDVLKKTKFFRTCVICMITDNDYVIPTAVAITSAIQNKSKQNTYHFYLLVNRVEAENLEYLSQLQRNNVKIDFIEVDISKYSAINVKTHVPQSAALKFDIPNLIHEDKVLYIDGDIIVQKDLCQLYDTDIKNYSVAAIRDMVGELKQKFHKAVGCRKYFNSGVMLLNLKKLREGNCSDLLILAKMEHPQWKCMDQDAFNYVLSSDTKWMDVKYNSMLALYHTNGFTLKQINKFYKSHYKTDKMLESDSVIIHLAGTPWQRPWQYSNGAFVSLWDQYYQKSPYKDFKLQRMQCCVKKQRNSFIKYLKFFSIFPFVSIEEQ